MGMAMYSSGRPLSLFSHLLRASLDSRRHDMERKIWDNRRSTGRFVYSVDRFQAQKSTGNGKAGTEPFDEIGDREGKVFVHTARGHGCVESQHQS